MSGELLANGKVTLHCGDCLEVMAALDECSIDSAVTDPPYHLTSIVRRFGAEHATLNKDYGGTGVYKRSAAGFMGKQWDGGDIAFRPETWALVYRALKPGGHLIAFAGTRQYHRMACAIEDAGFEIRDQLAWAYGSGFPKSHNVGKGIDKKFGAEREVIGSRKADDIRGGNLMHRATGEHEKTHTIDITAPATELARQWDGWGTALKPAWEPICLARKPLIGTVVDNVLAHGTGAINIDGCRIGDDLRVNMTGSTNERVAMGGGWREDAKPTVATGRFPANIIHDGSDEVVAAFPSTENVPTPRSGGFRDDNAVRGNVDFKQGSRPTLPVVRADAGSAARFFYSAKADGDDRLGSKHPTVKPVDLMQYLVRLVTPPGGTVLDCFAGTGTTGEAAFREGMRAVLIEREAEYQNDIRRRMTLVLGGRDERKNASLKASGKVEDAGPLFASL